jgi:ubiquinone/menaquinone biosynthesis C-methylase UbiE
MKAGQQATAMSYDQIANDYDQQWSVHVRVPQQRLTEELRLVPGLRCVDLGCGTGVDTLDMLRLVAPGEVVAVDCSEGMLEVAHERARAARLSLSLQREDATTFLEGAEPQSYDVLSLRFCLGYLDWRTLLPKLPKLLRPGGRVGILTILATSAPQAYEVYDSMIAQLGLPRVTRSAPDSLAIVQKLLRLGGARPESGWTHPFRLYFGTGQQVSSFLQESGIASHPLLAQLSPVAAAALWQRFGELIEAYREPGGIPLDFEVAGLVAHAGTEG